MSSTLPVEFKGMSVFIRVHEERMDWMKILIIGPEGTPYEDGSFDVHIRFSHSYVWQMLRVSSGSSSKIPYRMPKLQSNDHREGSIPVWSEFVRMWQSVLVSPWHLAGI